jgi:hypothetical protein
MRLSLTTIDAILPLLGSNLTKFPIILKYIKSSLWGLLLKQKSHAEDAAIPIQGTKASPGGVTHIFLLIIKGYLKAGQKKGAPHGRNFPVKRQVW